MKVNPKGAKSRRNVFDCESDGRKPSSICNSIGVEVEEEKKVIPNAMKSGWLRLNFVWQRE